MPLENPVTTSILMDHHFQPKIYEGERYICKHCGRLGHTSKTRPYYYKPQQDNNTENFIPLEQQSVIAIEWQTISFMKNAENLLEQIAPQGSPNPGINVKIFDAESGKFLSTQKISFKSKNPPSNETGTKAPYSASHLNYS